MAYARADVRRKKRDFMANPTPEFAWVPDFVSDINDRFHLPQVPIYIRKGKHNSGTTFTSRIAGVTHIVVVWADRLSIWGDRQTKKPSDIVKWILVHELAHVASTKRVVNKFNWVEYNTPGHGDEFYDCFWQIAKFAKIDLEHALFEEKRYKVRSSIKMAKVHGIKGAWKADREHKAALRQRREMKTHAKSTWDESLYNLVYGKKRRA